MEEAARISEEESGAKAAGESAAAESSDEEEEQGGSGFDIMALLAAEAEKLGNISPIDLMDTYGDKVIEISLEDLIAFNQNHKND